MSFESEMINGYPSEAEIDDFLSTRGLELPTPHNPNFILEYKQFIWGILNALDWVVALGVYCPSPATFNVRGGKYRFGDTVKTYMPGDAVDPTDNDTTYVWMAADNTIDSDIDGNGWPTTEHIKLAEIDTDEEGIITAIRDLRGETFLQKVGNLTGLHAANIGVNGGIPFILTATLVAGNTVVIHNANAPFKYRVVDVWGIATSGDSGTFQIKNGTNAITDAIPVGVNTEKCYVTNIDDAYHEIAAGGSLSVVGDGSLADCIVYISCIRVA